MNSPTSIRAGSSDGAWSSTTKVPSISLKGQSLTRTSGDKIRAALEAAGDSPEARSATPPPTTIIPPASPTTTPKALQKIELRRSNSDPHHFTNGVGNSTPTPSSPFTLKYPMPDESANNIENILAKPLLVKTWNQKKWKALGLAGRSELKTDTVWVTFKLPSGSVISKNYSLDLNALDIKAKILEEAGEGFVGKANEYDLRVAVINTVITAEALPIRRLVFLQACNISYISPHFEVVQRGSADSNDIEKLDIKKQIQLELEIFELVGPALSRTLDAYKPEVISLRKSLARLRGEIAESQATQPDADLQQFIYVDSEPMPLVMPAKLSILAQLPGMNAIRKRIGCDPEQSVDDVRREVFQKFAMIDKVNSAGKEPINYVLKATGFREYLLGNVQVGHNHRLANQPGGLKLIDFDYIRRCISKKKQIELTLVDASEVYGQVKDVEGASIIDQLLVAEQENTDAAEEYPYPTIHNSTPVLVTQVNRKFSLKVIGLRDVNLSRDDVKLRFVDKQPVIYVCGELFHGGTSIAPPVFTPLSQTFNDNPVYPAWGSWMEFNIALKDLPKAARLCLTLYAASESGSWVPPTEVSSKDVPLCWINFLLVDYDGCLKMGVNAMRMFDGVLNPIGTCVENLSAKNPTTLIFELETYIRPVVWPEMAPYTHAPSDSPLLEPRRKDSTKKLEPAEARQLQSVLAADPLYELKEDDKPLLWNFRHLCRPKAKALPKFLQAVGWNERDQVTEAYKMLQAWAPQTALMALELLDSKFPDDNVRKYATSALDTMTDAEVSDYLLQLVQVLKYEPHHDSALARFLMERALSNRSRIGHSFFWYLRAEMHVPEIAERYGLLLEGYLRSCGRHRTELIKQHTVLKSLLDVAMIVKSTPSPAEKKKVLSEGLSKIKFPDKFQLPFDPRVEVKGLQVDKCKYMDSKKQPLWLVFENVEPNVAPVYVMFKVGDDVRQDQLTLQLVRIMDKLWKNAGMDLRLIPYNVVATGNEIGMIEIVLNAKTIANINKDAGGSGAILDDNTLANWLRKHNPTEAEYKAAVDTFILSCAGYVVATYVLGIGDRHADNIMMTRTGNLFHIDFGHFLGNFKSKFGIKRERAPFIFTPQYLAIVGGKDSENFTRFVDTCCKAYNELRKSSSLIINLFQLMLSTGIPELQTLEDIKYLRMALAPELSDVEAATEFKKQINIALNTKTVIINDIIHGWAH